MSISRIYSKPSKDHSLQTHTQTHTRTVEWNAKIKNINLWSVCAANLFTSKKFVKIFVSVFLQSMKIYTWQKRHKCVWQCVCVSGSVCE